jgi:hypothetical protein
MAIGRHRLPAAYPGFLVSKSSQGRTGKTFILSMRDRIPPGRKSGER